jgi:ribosome-binding factor A
MSRQDRVTEAIRQEVSVIIHDELKDPRLGFVTITKVEMTPDLRYAKIFFSVLGQEEEHNKTKLALDSALGFIRKLIAERINLRLAPEIAFEEDRSTEYSVRIQEILDEIKQLDNKQPLKVRASKIKRKRGRVEPKKVRRVHKKK